MFWECSVSFNIVQWPPPSSSSCLFLLLSLSLSQEWCLSLRLCAPAMNTPTLSCTWTWARTPGCCRGRMPRSESAAHLETETVLYTFQPECDSGFLSLQNLYLFLSQPNCLVHLDLSGTDCPVDSVSVDAQCVCNGEDHQMFMCSL